MSMISGGCSSAGPSAGARSSGRVVARAMATQAQAPGASAAASGRTGTNPRVVVLGGGFGGLYAAFRLDQLMWPRGKKPQVTLVDQSDRFVFKPLLYELINGTATPEEVAPSLPQLLAPYPVRFVQAQVTGVHPAEAGATEVVHDGAGYVALSDGTSLPYDYLLVALGSQPDSRGVPGVREWAVPFNTYEDAVRVKGTLDLLSDSGAGGSVVIVGGGYAGVELAAVVGERLRGRRGGGGAVSVQLLTPGSDILEGSPEGQRAAANKALQDLGVQVVTGVRVEALGPPDDNGASVTALPTACTVSYSPATATSAAAAVATAPEQQQQRLAADVVIWTAGSSPATREARQGFPFPTNARGAIETEPSLRIRGSDTMFALGDVAVAAAATDPPSSASASPSAQSTTEVLPATAQVAFQQADYAAWNIWAAINGRPLLPFRYQHLGSMMSLGQINAAVALPLELPSPLADAVRSSPLGPLLGAAGVRLGDGRGGVSASAAAASPGGGVTLEGPLAALLRRGAYLYRQPTNEQRINVAASWLRMGLEAAAALAGGRGSGSLSENRCVRLPAVVFVV
ncbi:hypothetical protein VOLCADRAFT_107672 [Volvox carteri f. nagariensis]|uniref:FAD/NAD(P)-binding domain-containing protein n=1 Tax=Volvox carteri f. nagariensis TaxID=3068 RepID=D8UFK1_VOLCA|nr:uncharacterized protein VOLCADRAFT_107672 [Volvox carteri f. nagariensis]EFJ41470.1 hypothetical protein VOLCADRAFT_107672 [Volvox carteri f. nagariensis]|eukprot:XP_002957415.1 hypothetical protein VOLCADRAFT_107672 [Volvox carteri f. nagariensis]